MDTNHYKVRPGENQETLAARALGLRSSKDLHNIFDPSILVGGGQNTIYAYADTKDPERVVAVATTNDQVFNGTVERATVSTMTSARWDRAYDDAHDRTRPAYANGDAHFVSALMEEVGAKWPGREHLFDNHYREPSDDFQPRAPGRIKSAAAAAAAQTKTAQPKPRAHQGDAR